MAGKKPWYVLDEAPRRPERLRDADVLVEEAGPAPAEAGPFPGDGEILAGEAPGEEINTASVAPRPLSTFRLGVIGPVSRLRVPAFALNAIGTDISDSLDPGPAGGEDALAEGVVLDLGDDGESGELESTVEASHPAEE